MTTTESRERFTLALQPIHDADYVHVADRLIYRLHDAAVEDPVSRVASALSTVVYELDEAQRLGDRALFIDLPEEWLDRVDLLPTPAQQIVIGLPARFAPTPEALGELAALREAGYRFVVGEAQVADGALGELADVVAIDAARPLDEQRLAGLKADGHRLLAEGIVDHDRLQACRAAGVDYFNGRYLAEPRYHASRPPSRHGNRAAQLRLINELYREDADLQRLHDLLIQMPHLHVAILRRANSSHYARGRQPSELKRAMQLLGLRELRRLVMTLSLASDLPSSRLTVRLALIRGFMCQRLAEPFRNIDPEDAFTTGLFSMMGALLEEDQATLLEQVPLDDAIARALASHQGHLGAILSLCEEHERQLEARPPDHDADRLQQCYLAALEQTDALMGLL